MFGIQKIVQGVTKIKPLKITAESVNHGVKIKSQTDQTYWEIHNPLQSILASLAGCEFSTIKGVSSHGKIKVKSMNFKKVESGYELQRFMKGGPQNRINEIFIEAEVQTTGTQEDLDQLQKKVINACPVYQMLTKAGVKITNNWKNIQVAP